jgi:CHAT domain-containing protein
MIFNRLYLHNKNVSLKILILMILIFVGILNISAQRASIDYFYLEKLNKASLEKWIQSKSKARLSEAAVNLTAKSEIYISNHDLSSAKNLLLTSLIVAESSDNSFILGKIYYLRGIILIEFSGEKANQTASNYFTKAKEYLLKTNTEASKILLGKVFLELAELRIKSQTTTDYKDALLNINLAYRLASEIKSDHLTGLAYKSWGLYFFFQENYVSALAFFEKAEDLLNMFSDQTTLLELKTFSTYLFINLQSRQQAFEAQSKAMNLVNYAVSTQKTIFFLKAKAYFFNVNGDSVEAIKSYQSAQKLAYQIGDFRKAISFQFSIGKTYQWEGDNVNAEIEFRRIISSVPKLQIEDELLILRSKIGLATALNGQGRVKESQMLFKEVGENIGDSKITQREYYESYTAFLISQNDFSNAKTFIELTSRNTKYPDALIHLKTLKLWLDYKTKDISPEVTLQKLDESIALIKDEQLNTRNVGINLNYLDEFIFPFRFKTLVQIEKGDIESALLHTDSFKSRWLISKISSDKSFGVINKSWIVSDEAKELRNKIFQQLLISGLRGEDESDVELNYLLKIHEKKLNLRQDVSVLAKNFEKTEISQNELKDLTATLSKSAILSYSFTPEFLSVFVVRQNQPVKVFKIAVKEKSLREKIEKWRGEIINQNLGFKKESHELYDLLIKPLETEIEDASDLIIIPEGILWKLPFQALLDARQKYLIQKAPISYVPSLKVLHTLQKRTLSTGIRKVVGFGNPFNSAIKPLPEAENEVKNLAAFYPSISYKIGVRATETALKEAMGAADILHLAVHGKLDEIEPMRSSILMAKDSQNDGNFEIEEIIGMTRSPELVILSACDTNDGQVFNGEGLLSLSWAFLAAGSKNVVGTEWKIDDQVTSQEMNLFHQKLSQNVRIAQSLQFAVLQQIEKKGIQNHPFYWACFVSIGAV